MAPNQVAGSGGLVLTQTMGPGGDGAQRSRGWSPGGPIGWAAEAWAGWRRRGPNNVKATMEKGSEKKAC